ncbi:unnamed protein product [Cladocopium goreaui]|uniref:Uncharacterized protein n=1 Tax=Cladocopium goreaui TaxID=2562237 RepID=A0A9P1M1R3_9DINO|nr:unnamed protein product [Cladocopium goreaui]
MATILESEAAFNARALEHGLTRAQLERLQNQGLTNLSKLAFSLTTPGTVPPDDALKGLLADNLDEVTIGQLSSIRRLMFDAQTLCASQMKTTISGADHGRKAELVPAERATRIQQQRTRLQGMELTGPLECAHSSYDYVAKMLEADVPMYLEPHRFTTRASEVARERPGKELVLDNINLTVKDVERKDKCQISNELQLHQALTRRSLACDLMQACSFRNMEKWHRHLLDHLQLPSPPGFRQPTMEQVLRADRTAWVKMAEKVTTLRRQGDGSLPLNRALDELPADPSIMFHLMPLPVDKSTSTPKHTEPKSTAGSDQGPPNIRKKDKKDKSADVDFINACDALGPTRPTSATLHWLDSLREDCAYLSQASRPKFDALAASTVLVLMPTSQSRSRRQCSVWIFQMNLGKLYFGGFFNNPEFLQFT